MARRRKLLGEAWVDKSIKGKNSQRLDPNTSWVENPGGLFGRRTRRVLVIGTGARLVGGMVVGSACAPPLIEGGFMPGDLLRRGGRQPRLYGSLSYCS